MCVAKFSCQTKISNAIFQYHSFCHFVRRANSDKFLSTTNTNGNSGKIDPLREDEIGRI